MARYTELKEAQIKEAIVLMHDGWELISTHVKSATLSVNGQWVREPVVVYILGRGYRVYDEEKGTDLIHWSEHE